ncbi:MAG: MerR family transcriptional regulator [Fimbriimonadaceae bacterium]|nr:MAG: MerR family transcriptional regulator [Fimbriimonadaceae bacterium]
MPPTYSISAVAKASGLSVHTIRAWEKRYGVTNPERTDTNRRKYTLGDIERFRLLRQATENGHSIGMIAELSTEELQNLDNTAEVQNPLASNRNYLAACLQAMMNLDADALEEALSHAGIVLGIDRFLSEVVVPLLKELDSGWEERRISIAQEHLASAVLRTQLEKARLTIQVPSHAPRILVTTPSGQLHEIGALLAAISAARHGWNVTYLGPNLPSDEIAAAVAKTHSNAIGLSLVYPADDPLVDSELLKIRELLPTTPIIIGGRVISHYRQTIQAIGAHIITDDHSLKQLLRSLS